MTKSDATRVLSQVERLATDARELADRLALAALAADQSAYLAEAKLLRVTDIATKEVTPVVDEKVR